MRSHVPSAGGGGSIPGQESKIPRAAWCGQKKKNRDSNLTWHPVFSFAKSGNATLKSSFYIILAQLPILQMGKQKRLNVLTQLSVATPGFEAGLLTSSLATQYTIK